MTGRNGLGVATDSPVEFTSHGEGPGEEHARHASEDGVRDRHPGTQVTARRVDESRAARNHADPVADVLRKTMQPLVDRTIIIIEEDDPVTRSGRQTGVAGRRQPTIQTIDADQPGIALRCDDRRGVVGGAVVHHQQLEVVELLA